MPNIRTVVAAVAVTLVYFLAIGLGVSWLIATNNGYVPIAASLVSGGATLFGVGVAALVLRFNYLSQVNPLRVEYYKKRCECIVELHTVISGLWYSTRVEKPEDTYVPFGSDVMKAVEDATEKLSAVMMKGNLYLPDQAIANVVIFMQFFDAWIAHKNKTDGQRREKVDEYLWRKNHAAKVLTNQWKRLIGHYELAEGTAVVIGQELDERAQMVGDHFERRTPRQTRFYVTMVAISHAIERLTRDRRSPRGRNAGTPGVGREPNKAASTPTKFD